MDATSQYLLPSGVAAMSTTAALSALPPIEPRNGASPKLKMPPSDATSQYDLPRGRRHADDGRVERLATHGTEETGVAELKMPPSEATSQYPLPSGVAAMPTMGELSGLPRMDLKKLASPKLKTPPSDATSRSARGHRAR